MPLTVSYKLETTAGAVLGPRPRKPVPCYYWPVLGLVVGPGEVPGVGLVVAGVSVPVPPLLEPDMPPPPELPLVPVSEPEPELPFSGMLLPDVPVDEPLVPASEPPPVMPAHALSSIAHARGIIHFVINHSCKDKKSGTRKLRYRRMHAYAEDRITPQREVLASACFIEFTQAKAPLRLGRGALACGGGDA